MDESQPSVEAQLRAILGDAEQQPTLPSPEAPSPMYSMPAFMPQTSLERDKAAFAGNVHQGLANAVAGINSLAPKTNTDAANMALYATPGVGNVLSARDAYNAAQQGDWRGATLGLAGIFGGPLAKTADHAALARASEMHAAGHSAEDIWHATGWFQGADNKWRFEIPDDQAAFNRDAMQPLESKYGASKLAGPASEVLAHPDLYGAYPQLQDMRFLENSRRDDTLGSYTPSQSGPGLVEMYLKRTPEQLKSTGLHESQHAIQNSEGFALGANPTIANNWTHEIFDNPEDAQTFLNSLNTTAKEKAFITQTTAGQPAVAYKPYGNLLPYEAYRQHAGEVEARNVQARMNMTPDELRATPPWVTQDVPNEQQIVRFGNGSQASLDDLISALKQGKE